MHLRSRQEQKNVLVRIVNRIPAPVAARFRSGSLLSRLAAPVLEVALPRRTVDVVVRSGPAAGFRLPIDPQCEKYYWTGAHELRVLEAITDLLRPGDLFWDIGAHIGFFTVVGARAVGPTGRVVAFEPMPLNRERLCRTVELNDLRQVSVRSQAVSGCRGVGYLHEHSSTTMWSLVRKAGGGGVEVDCVTLDDVFMSRPTQVPALVKIDAEGVELEILRGGPRLIAESAVSFIVELSYSDMIGEARSLLVNRTIKMLSARHLLARPAA
jgi:FkbM family methyltransferase